MKDLLLDDNEDLVLNSKGDVQFTDSVGQAIKIRLRWFSREWKMNRSYGLPWYEEVLGVKHPSLALLESRARDAIREVTEVKDITYLRAEADERARTMALKFAVTCVDGHDEKGEVTVS